MQRIVFFINEKIWGSPTFLGNLKRVATKNWLGTTGLWWSEGNDCDCLEGGASGVSAMIVNKHSSVYDNCIVLYY